MIYIAEVSSDSLSAAELRKREKMVRGEKRVCRGKGCLTRISAYNLDEKGNQAILCYGCQESGNKPTVVPKLANGRPSNECKNGHDKDEVGQWQGVCAACKRENDRSRARKKAKAAGKTYYPNSEYLALDGLAALIERRGVKMGALEAAIGIPSRSLSCYAYSQVKCHPERAPKIAEFFGVTIEELTRGGA